jgi:hypothetical protein
VKKEFVLEKGFRAEGTWELNVKLNMGAFGGPGRGRPGFKGQGEIKTAEQDSC